MNEGSINLVLGHFKQLKGFQLFDNREMNQGNYLEILESSSVCLSVFCDLNKFWFSDSLEPEEEHRRNKGCKRLKVGDESGINAI